MSTIADYRRAFTLEVTPLPTTAADAFDPKSLANTSPGGVVVFCDGAALNNPGPAGSGVIIADAVTGEVIAERAFALGTATNNEAELVAAIEALRALSPGLPSLPPVTIRADSQYVVKGITEWLPGWKAKGWRKGDGKPVLNRELWERLEDAAKGFPGCSGSGSGVTPGTR
jgi:ribonuclease HI